MVGVGVDYVSPCHKKEEEGQAEAEVVPSSSLAELEVEVWVEAEVWVMQLRINRYGQILLFFVRCV